jgi:hypothetical protein
LRSRNSRLGSDSGGLSSNSSGLSGNSVGLAGDNAERVSLSEIVDGGALLARVRFALQTLTIVHFQ